MGQETSSLWNDVKKFEGILRGNPRAYSFAPLSVCYTRLGLLDDAFEIARRGCSIHPDFAAGQMAFARVCIARSLSTEAREALEKVVSITPENIEAQSLLADLYRAVGNVLAAENCLKVIGELDPDFVSSAGTQDAVPVQSAASMDAAATVDDHAVSTSDLAAGGADLDEEEILDADILELTDDLIEEELISEEIYAPFAASPERPSLYASVTREEPPVTSQVMPVAGIADVMDESLQAASEAAPLAPEVASQSPVATATIAELYVSQGLADKGADVYRELLREDPENIRYRERLNALTHGQETLETAMPTECKAAVGPGSDAMQPNSPEGVVEILQGWLMNIGRNRECRIKSH